MFSFCLRDNKKRLLSPPLATFGSVHTQPYGDKSLSIDRPVQVYFEPSPVGSLLGYTKPFLSSIFLSHE